MMDIYTRAEWPFSHANNYRTEMKKQTKSTVFLDHYLSTLGLWRKPVARDGLSLFRAVSEQLFLTQTFHTNLYEACRIVFFHLGKHPETDWTETEVIRILSKMYRRDFLVYENVGQPPYKASATNYGNKIVLCRVGETQLESVYPIRFQEDAALCQSIVYEILYHGVFKLDSELTEAVTLIRDQSKKKMRLFSNRFDDLEDSCIEKVQHLHVSVKDRQLRKPSPPVPYRIAKALDPYLYRNVELDIWEEEKREQFKLSPEYRARFAPGDKCQILLEGDHYHGHIQEISAHDNTAVVFIHELGEKKCVFINCLKSPPSSKYSCSSHSKYLERKQDMSVTSSAPGGYRNDSTAIRYPIYQARSPVKPEIGYTSLNYQGYSSGTAYSYQGEVMANTATTGYVGMDTSPVQNAINNTQTNMNSQMSQQGVLQRYAPQVPSMLPQGAVANPYVYNCLVPTGTSNQTYSCVCVPYLESIAMKDVNMNSLPSQDVEGKDLPEMNTLRFFYNLGVENYRIIGHGGPVWPTVEMPPMMPANGVMTQDQLNGNSFGQFALPPPIQYSSQNDQPTSEHNEQNGERSNQAYHYHPYIPSIPQGSSVCKRKSPPESLVTSPNKSQTMSQGDESIESTDSGCDSDSTSSAQCNGCKEIEENNAGTTTVELEQKLDNYIAKVDENDDSSCISSTTEFQVPAKPKSKRKFYMYGNLKLVKPIKDIPPKFLSMLNSLSAEKARCEGEPIIIPFLPPKPYRKYNKPQSGTDTNSTTSSTESHGFNPEAKCFVPGDSVMHDPSIVACSNPNAPVQYVYGIYPSSKPDGSLVYQSNMQSVYTSTPQSLAQTNSGDGSQGSTNTLCNLSNTNYGDGSKYSMPTFSTGQACPTYPASCPVYYAGPGSYNGAQTFLPPPNAVTGHGAFPQLCSMPPQVNQVQAI